MKLQAEVQALPDKLAADALPALAGDKNYTRGSNFISDELGLELRDLAPEIAQKLGLDANSGVIVTAVRPEGIAAPSGIRKGMIILRVGQKTVHSVAEFKAAIKDESLEKGILLLVRTQSGNRFLLLK